MNNNQNFEEEDIAQDHQQFENQNIENDGFYNTKDMDIDADDNNNTNDANPINNFKNNYQRMNNNNSNNNNNQKNQQSFDNPKQMFQQINELSQKFENQSNQLKQSLNNQNNKFQNQRNFNNNNNQQRQNNNQFNNNRNYNNNNNNNGGYNKQNFNRNNNYNQNNNNNNNNNTNDGGEDNNNNNQIKGILKKNQNFNNRFQQQQPQQQVVVNKDAAEIQVLMVAEKPSIARAVTDALAGNNGFQTRKGIAKHCPIHEYNSEFQGRSAFFKVTSVTGHIYHTDFPQEYQDWRKVNPITLFDAPTEKKETNPNNQLIEHLKAEAEGVHYLILWLDNDKEGENICFEVIEIAKEKMIEDKDIPTNIYRAKFSSITKPDIQEAFISLNSGPNYFESISVDARQIIDLKIGVAFSRFQTMYLVKKYEEFSQKKITFGPCQTPTLGFCVQRHDEIKSFVSQPFYKPQPKLVMQDGSEITFDWDKERTFDQEEAIKIKEEIERNNSAVVDSVTNKMQTRGRPEGMNTVQLLKLASQWMGLGPQQTMHVAEKLYLGGYITYPRTESTSYPSKFDFVGVLNALQQNNTFQDYIERLLKSGLEKPKQGKDAGDHPPITPTNKVAMNLYGDEAKMYEYISRVFLATVSADAKFMKKIVHITIGDQHHGFSLKGTTLVEKGFTDIMTWIKIHDNYIPDFKEGESFMIASCDIHQGKTTPPDYLSESDLITLMEKHQIGTDASMATHINNVCEREYVKVVSNQRKLVPTNLGIALAHGYTHIDNELVDPELRQKIEQSVELIAQGEVNYDEVLNEVLELFKHKYINFTQSINSLEQFFEPYFLTIQKSAMISDYFSQCGRCKNKMKLLQKSNKLYCEICNYTYTLPKQGQLNLLQNSDQFCDIDQFQLVSFVPTLDSSSLFILCPCCHNNKFPEELKSKLVKPICQTCQNKECEFVANSMVGKCTACQEGQLILDHPNYQSKFTTTCDKCSQQFIITNRGSSVVKTSFNCDVCESAMIKIKEVVKEPGQARNVNEIMICIFCDPGYLQQPKPKQYNNQQRDPNNKQNFFNKRRQFNNNNNNNNNNNGNFRQNGPGKENNQRFQNRQPRNFNNNNNNNNFQQKNFNNNNNNFKPYNNRFNNNFNNNNTNNDQGNIETGKGGPAYNNNNKERFSLNNLNNMSKGIKKQQQTLSPIGQQQQEIMDE